MLRALRKYIHMVVSEAMDTNPAAPNQLLPLDEKEGGSENDEVEENAAGGGGMTAGGLGPGAGVILPLGLSPQGPIAKKKKT